MPEELRDVLLDSISGKLDNVNKKLDKIINLLNRIHQHLIIKVK